MKYWKYDHPCCQYCKEIAGLVGAVSGDIDVKVRQLIYELNKAIWREQKALDTLRNLLEDIKFELSDRKLLIDIIEKTLKEMEEYNQ